MLNEIYTRIRYECRGKTMQNLHNDVNDYDKGFSNKILLVCSVKIRIEMITFTLKQ